MEMTTPVFTRRTQSEGEKMEMTTPVVTKRVRLNYLVILPFVPLLSMGLNLYSNLCFRINLLLTCKHLNS